MKTKVLHKNF